MKESENKKNTVFVTDGSQNNTSDIVLESSLNNGNKFKKPLIFALMGIVFLGCIYLIFEPSGNSKGTQDAGLNDSVPEATDNGLQDDKQKAYEEALLEQKNLEQRNSLLTLSDYWKEDDTASTDSVLSEYENETSNKRARNTNPSLDSYRNAQQTLGSFYQTDHSETLQLRKQLDEAKEQLAQKNETSIDPVESQLELMEKSYQMAAKYLPVNTVIEDQPKEQQAFSSPSSQKEAFVAFAPARKNVVSSLYRVSKDSTFLANWSESRNRQFFTVGTTEQPIQLKNSIRAVVQQTQLVTQAGSVRLHLLEAAKIGNHIIPQGTEVTANCKFQQGRLQMKINSIAQDGTIIPVDIIVYGLDGQEGLFVPYSPEMSAFKEMAANMGQTSGSSIMMTNSAGQQIAGDLSRGLVQGVSGYFSKKMRAPKVTLKAGHQVFLVSQN